jgi:hypothetical protein
VQTLESDLKDMESSDIDPSMYDGTLAREFALEAEEINKKIKETETELNSNYICKVEFKRIMYGKLAECNNKKKFI